MFHKMIYAMRGVPSYSALCLGFAWMLLVSAALVGCQPSAEATLLPATAVAPSPPAPATAIAESQATLTTPVAADNTATPTTEGKKTPTEAKPFQLTILHTNDTYGEVDPCG